ncbi:unnamed protein product, partial [Polarella glacialis]
MWLDDRAGVEIGGGGTVCAEAKARSSSLRCCQVTPRRRRHTWAQRSRRCCRARGITNNSNNSSNNNSNNNNNSNSNNNSSNSNSNNNSSNSNSNNNSNNNNSITSRHSHSPEAACAAQLADQREHCGSEERAVERLRQAIELDKGDPIRSLQYRTNLGCALHRLGNSEESLEVLQDALERVHALKSSLPPSQCQGLASLECAVRVNLSCALGSHRKPGSFEERAAHLEEAFRLQPSSLDASFHLSASREEGGDALGALQILRSALSARPDDLNCLALACRCLESLGRHQEALAMCEKLCGLDPASTFLALREVFCCKPGDVFVVTFPRCGTTWMVQIAVSCIFGAAADYDAHAVFVEGGVASSASFVRALDELPAPRVLKTHAPADMHPGLERKSESELQKNGKVVYVVRNPKDALVSLRHHHANNASIGWNGSWDEWVDQWLAGKRSEEYGGTYFDHVKGWWRLAKLHPDRVRVVYFEDIKANMTKEVAAVASFIGRTLPSEELDQVCTRCTFEAMKGRHSVDDTIR